MGFQAVCLADNRDAQEMYGYLEARIETLKRRIIDLESENEILRSKVGAECGTISRLLSSRPNSY